MAETDSADTFHNTWFTQVCEGGGKKRKINELAAEWADLPVPKVIHGIVFDYSRAIKKYRSHNLDAPLTAYLGLGEEVLGYGLPERIEDAQPASRVVTPDEGLSPLHPVANNVFATTLKRTDAMVEASGQRAGVPVMKEMNKVDQGLVGGPSTCIGTKMEGELMVILGESSGQGGATMGENQVRNVGQMVIPGPGLVNKKVAKRKTVTASGSSGKKTISLAEAKAMAEKLVPKRKV